MTPPTTDTSREAVEAHLNDVEVDATEASFRTVVLLRAVCAERDEWRAAFGHFLSEIPLQDVLGASGSVQDAIDYFKTAIAERDALRDQLAAARNEALEEAALWAESEGLFRTRDEIRALKSTIPASREVTVQEALDADKILAAANTAIQGYVDGRDSYARGVQAGISRMSEALRALSKEEKIDG